MVMGRLSKCCARARGTVLAMLAASGGFLTLHAQPGRTTLLAEHLRTPRWKVDGDATKLPIIQLGTHQQLEFSFDDLTHEYAIHLQYHALRLSGEPDRGSLRK